MVLLLGLDAGLTTVRICIILSVDHLYVAPVSPGRLYSSSHGHLTSTASASSSSRRSQPWPPIPVPLARFVFFGHGTQQFTASLFSAFPYSPYVVVRVRRLTKCPSGVPCHGQPYWRPRVFDALRSPSATPSTLGEVSFSLYRFIDRCQFANVNCVYVSMLLRRKIRGI
jgi:hypothetical protein